jgi:hypothetical protein
MNCSELFSPPHGNKNWLVSSPAVLTVCTILILHINTELVKQKKGVNRIRIKMELNLHKHTTQCLAS